MPMTLRENIADAKRSVAETAIGSPYIYHEYGEWQDAKHAVVAAQARLAIAEKRWLRLLEPVQDDKLLMQLAKRKGLLPSGMKGEFAVELRWKVGERTTTEPPVLQVRSRGAWPCPWSDWADVPRVVVPEPPAGHQEGAPP
jgi:hypothetical protein